MRGRNQISDQLEQFTYFFILIILYYFGKLYCIFHHNPSITNYLLSFFYLTIKTVNFIQISANFVCGSCLAVASRYKLFASSIIFPSYDPAQDSRHGGHNRRPQSRSIPKIDHPPAQLQGLRTLSLKRHANNWKILIRRGNALSEAFYRFKRPQPACFRIHNLSHSTQNWSLYTISLQSNEQTFLDSATFNIQRTIKLQQVELLQKQREVRTSMRQKNVNKNMILELWGHLRREMKSSRSVQKCIFANQDYQIEFQVQIKNTLDFQLERLQEEQQMMALRRVRSDQLRNSHADNKNRQPPSVIELQSVPYRSVSHPKEENHTKQTTQDAIAVDKNDDNDEDFNATVKIVNPLGQQLDEKQQVFVAGTIRRNSEQLSQYMMPIPNKKFSLLSDIIIEMSHEGSSSYRPDQSSSNGNRITLRKDTAVDFALQNKNDLQVEHLNKFKTLPYEGHHRIQLGDEFRRAQTAQKSQVQSQMQQSYLSANQQPETHSEGKLKALLDRYSTKWKVIALLIILFGMGAILMAPQKKKRRKSRH